MVLDLAQLASCLDGALVLDDGFRRGMCAIGAFGGEASVAIRAFVIAGVPEVQREHRGVERDVAAEFLERPAGLEVEPARER